MQEKGEIQMIYDKWWKSPGLTCIRDEINKEGKASPLGLENIGGVFAVLLVGLALALFTAMSEFFIKAKKNALKSKQSICTEMHDELGFIWKCEYTRPKRSATGVPSTRYCSKCNYNSSYITTSLAVPHDNGVMSGLDFRKSPQMQCEYDSS
ncbi:unnamed protein product [Medioppia subpectinata]|uniref:Uncharacterized protein n=1 Tax=Medioppia subpectinata TaxID=1979941 RepID=A0A7R9Q4W7_9ACAR|nr:unnamed protein product [Medioppia subpectinata]CAG2112705.1 unnamed protein product [Medioppia subpectinata]